MSNATTSSNTEKCWILYTYYKNKLNFIVKTINQKWVNCTQWINTNTKRQIGTYLYIYVWLVLVYIYYIFNIYLPACHISLINSWSNIDSDGTPIPWETLRTGPTLYIAYLSRKMLYIFTIIQYFFAEKFLAIRSRYLIDT